MGGGLLYATQGSSNCGSITLQPVLSYMTSGAQILRKSFIEVGRGFSGVLLGSWTLRWRVPRMVLGVVVLGDPLLGC
jgi:hypothetical protein